MPNMFGGDQDHPAYDSRTVLKENQIQSGTTVYTVTFDEDDEAHVTEWRIDKIGTRDCNIDLLSTAVKNFIETLRERRGK